MTDLAQALRAAGFPGAETDGDRVFARLVAADVEFSGRALPEGWELSISRPVRASDRQRADWAALHPQAPLDIHQGETRLAARLPAGDTTALTRWAAQAEALVVACLHWRRDQRAGGEGM